MTFLSSGAAFLETPKKCILVFFLAITSFSLIHESCCTAVPAGNSKIQTIINPNSNVKTLVSTSKHHSTIFFVFIQSI